MNTQKRLYRSTTDSHVAGVCGGIAEYLEVDPTLVRLAFVALTLMGGPGLIIYIILWLVVPEAPEGKRKSKQKNEVYYEDVVRSEIPTAPSDDQEP
ncbi:MAG: PspC domain-containing protein [Chloroflexota bacterium]|nr:PspC domain-containing protein [Anaerolineae bacterium]HMM26974.1 PspC domain-containing protein [Aggregatilineaceae bacterium]